MEAVRGGGTSRLSFSRRGQSCRSAAGSSTSLPTPRDISTKQSSVPNQQSTKESAKKSLSTNRGLRTNQVKSLARKKFRAIDQVGPLDQRATHPETSVRRKYVLQPEKLQHTDRVYLTEIIDKVVLQKTTKVPSSDSMGR